MAAQSGLGGLDQIRKQYAASINAYPEQSTRKVLQRKFDRVFANVKSNDDLLRAGREFTDYLSRNARNYNAAVDDYVDQLDAGGYLPAGMTAEQARQKYRTDVATYFEPLRKAARQTFGAVKAKVSDEYKLTDREKLATDISLGARRTTFGALGGTALDAFTGPMYLGPDYEENRLVSGTVQALGMGAELGLLGAGALAAKGASLGSRALAKTLSLSPGSLAARLGGELGLRAAGRVAGERAASAGAMGVRELAKKALQGDTTARAILKTGAAAGAGVGTTLGLYQTGLQALPAARPQMADLGSERVAAPGITDYLYGAGTGLLGGAAGGAAGAALRNLAGSGRLGAGAAEILSEVVGAAPEAGIQLATTGKVDIAGLLPGIGAAGLVGSASAPDIKPTIPVAKRDKQPAPQAPKGPARAWTAEEVLDPKRTANLQTGDTITLPNQQGGEDSYEVVVEPRSRASVRVRDKATNKEYDLPTDPNRGIIDGLTMNFNRGPEKTPTPFGKEPTFFAAVKSGSQPAPKANDVLQLSFGNAGNKRYIVQEITPEGAYVLQDGKGVVYDFDAENADPMDVTASLIQRSADSPATSVINSANAIRGAVGRNVLATTLNAVTQQPERVTIQIESYDPNASLKGGGQVKYVGPDGKRQKSSLKDMLQKFSGIEAYDPFRPKIKEYTDASPADKPERARELIELVVQEVENAEQSGYAPAALFEIQRMANELRATKRPDLQELAGWMSVMGLPADQFARSYNYDLYDNASEALSARAEELYYEGVDNAVQRALTIMEDPSFAALTDAKEINKLYRKKFNEIVGNGFPNFVKDVKEGIDEALAKAPGGTSAARVAQAVATAEPETAPEAGAAPARPATQPTAKTPTPEAESEADGAPMDDEAVRQSQEYIDEKIKLAEDAWFLGDKNDIKDIVADVKNSIDAGLVAVSDVERFTQSIGYLNNNERVPAQLYVTVPGQQPEPAATAEPAEAPKPAEATKVSEAPKAAEATKPAEPTKAAVSKTETKAAATPAAPATKPAEPPAAGREVKTGGGRGNPPRTFVIDAELPDGSMVLRNKTPRGVSQPYTAPADSPQVLAIRAKEAKAAEAEAAKVTEPAPQPEGETTPAPEDTPAGETTPAPEGAPKDETPPAPQDTTEAKPKSEAKSAPKSEPETVATVEPRTINVPTKAAELLSKGNLTQTQRPAMLGIEKMREAVAKRDAAALDAAKSEALANIERFGKNDRIAATDMKALVEDTYTMVKDTLDKALAAPKPARRRQQAPKAAETTATAAPQPAAETSTPPAPKAKEQAPKPAAAAETPAAPKATVVRSIRQTLFRRKGAETTTAGQIVNLSNGQQIIIEKTKGNWYRAVLDPAEPASEDERWLGSTLDEVRSNIDAKFAEMAARPEEVPTQKRRVPGSKPQREYVPEFIEEEQTVPAASIPQLVEKPFVVDFVGRRPRLADKIEVVRGREMRVPQYGEAPVTQYRIDSIDNKGTLSVRLVEGNKTGPLQKVARGGQTAEGYNYDGLIAEARKEQVGRLPEVPLQGAAVERLKRAVLLPEYRDQFDSLANALRKEQGNTADVEKTINTLRTVLEQKPQTVRTSRRNPKYAEEVAAADARYEAAMDEYAKAMREASVDLEETYRQYEAAPGTTALEYKVIPIEQQLKAAQNLDAKLQKEIDTLADMIELAKTKNEPLADFRRKLRQLERTKKDVQQEIETLSRGEKESIYSADELRQQIAEAEKLKKFDTADALRRQLELLIEQSASGEDALQTALDRVRAKKIGRAAELAARVLRRAREREERVTKANAPTIERMQEIVAAGGPDAEAQILRLKNEKLAEYDQMRRDAFAQTMDQLAAKVKDEGVSAPVGIVAQDYAASIKRLERELAAPAGKNSFEQRVIEIAKELEKPFELEAKPGEDLTQLEAAETERRQELLAEAEGLAKFTRDKLRKDLLNAQKAYKDEQRRAVQLREYFEALGERGQEVLNQTSKLQGLIENENLSPAEAAKKLLEGGKRMTPKEFEAATKVVSLMKEADARTRRRNEASIKQLEAYAEAIAAEARQTGRGIPIVERGQTVYYSVAKRDNIRWLMRKVDENGLPLLDKSGKPVPLKEYLVNSPLVRRLKKAEAGGDSDAKNRPAGRYVVDASGMEYVVDPESWRRRAETGSFQIYAKSRNKWDKKPITVRAPEGQPDNGDTAGRQVVRAMAVATLEDMPLSREEAKLFETILDPYRDTSAREKENALKKLEAMGPAAQARYETWRAAAEHLLDSGLFDPYTGSAVGQRPVAMEEAMLDLAEEAGQFVSKEAPDDPRPYQKLEIADLAERYLEAKAATEPEPIRLTADLAPVAPGSEAETDRLYKVRSSSNLSKQNARMIEATIRTYGGEGGRHPACRAASRAKAQAATGCADAVQRSRCLGQSRRQRILAA